jgi:hypothetical protein
LAEIEARREAGLPVGSTTGALTEERRDALEAIDPSWCPAWPVAWQRCYKLRRNLIEAGTELPTTPGQMTLQGEDDGGRGKRLCQDFRETGTVLPCAGDAPSRGTRHSACMRSC